MHTLTLQPLSAAAAREMADWRYPTPYNVYDITLDADEVEAELSYLTNPDTGYFEIRDSAGQLIGFCCFGDEARVPGGDYASPALDIGFGLRPDLTGQGYGGPAFRAVLAFAEQHYGPQRLRATVAEFNQRAQRLCLRNDFVQVAHFYSELNRQHYLVFTR